LSSPEPAGRIQSYLIQIILGEREFKFVQIKGQVLFKGEIITKLKKKWGGVISKSYS
jgi:Fe-S cluster assembly ATPase SufC